MSQWQPIETAPKDGQFLIAERRPTSWEYHVRHIVLYPAWSERLKEKQLEYASHWMPLPPPPQQEEGKNLP